ncbi:uncharacterized protein LOC134271830 [Saccostrea cucullata]|uniref:uncharacterized protein LOC134271830 n=1 Tax=Saccostrea cuccullata TaxID=36930 RepID=UPI002ED27284
MEMDEEEIDLSERTDMGETVMLDGNTNDMCSTENINMQNLLKVGWDDDALTKYIHKIWSKKRNDSVEPYLLSKTCGVSINNKSLISANSLITEEIIDAYLGIICGVSKQYHWFKICHLKAIMYELIN